MEIQNLRLKQSLIILGKELVLNPRHLEGYENKKWVLLDYFDIIVHVFDEKEREYYSDRKHLGRCTKTRI